MKNIYLYALLILAIMTNIALGAETVYVSSKQLKIYKEAKFTSDLIGTLKKDDALDVIQRKGVWLQIERPPLKGWVPKYSTTATKPYKKKISIFSRIKNFFRHDSNRDRVALVSTTGGIRGLSEGEEDSSGKKDFAAVENMEGLKVSPEEVDKFIQGNSN